jgi:tungstate transport system substrate-binding protein
MLYNVRISGPEGMPMRKPILALAAALACATAILVAVPASAASKNLILATTTSTQDSGLLDVLIPEFEKKTGFFVKTIAVGSGQAMAMGEKGEADVLLVHSPAAEEKFMKAGFGASRALVMHNDFVVIGPPPDPAGIRGTAPTSAAFRKIAEKGALFLSRGDNSGTHAKELGLWKSSGAAHEGAPWYQQTGLGMGQTLSVAAEKKGYTLSDRGTYLAMRKSLGLDILVEGDRDLLNVYHVIVVNPAKWPKVNAEGANAFAGFLVAADTQKAIGTFGVGKFGAPLFFPDAGKKVEELGR